MKRLLLILLFLLLPVWCGAGTYYVSQSATNGYQIGVDTNAGTSKDAPFLTFGKARITATADGDIVYFNEGTYLSTDGASGTNYFRLQYSVSWLPEPGTTVIWKANNAAYAVYFAASSGKTPYLGAITIDATGATQSTDCIQAPDAMTNTGLTLDGTKLINYTGWAFNTSTNYNLTVRGVTATATNNTLGGFRISANNTGIIDIDGLSLNMTSNVAATQFLGVYIAGSSAPTTAVSIKNVTADITTSATNTYVDAIYVRNIDNADISENDITLTAANTSANSTCIRVANTGATLTANGAAIHGNTCAFNSAVGYAIKVSPFAVGTDAANHTNNARVYRNTLTGIENGQTGTPHGISLEDNTGGEAYQNTIDNFSPAILLAKTDSTTKAYYNKITKPYGDHVLYFKGASGSQYINNTVYGYTGFKGCCLAVQAHADTTANTNPVFENNLCYINAASPEFTRVATGNSAVFTTNIYYATGALAPASWNYGETNYNTWAGWKAAEGAGDTAYADPLFRSATDYRLKAGSPAINAGTSTSSGTATLANSRLSLVNGTAFVDFSSAGTLTPYLGGKLTLTDSAGKKAIGYIKAAGTGETLGENKLTNGDFATGDGTGWTEGGLGTADEDYTDNELTVTMTGTGSKVYSQIPTLTNNALYKSTITVRDYSCGGRVIYTRFGGIINLTENITANGTFSGYAVKTAAYLGFNVGNTSTLTSGDVFTIDGLSLKQVLTPSATGVTITSTPGGTTYNWTSIESGFNFNDSAGYTYTISDFLPTTDYAGRPIRGLPDIGAYEFYGTGSGLLMGLGVGF